MSRRTQLLIIVLAVLAISSSVSHIAARTLKIRTQAVTPLTFGTINLPARGAVAGSSLMFYGVNWAEVSRTLGMRLEGWGIPAGSVLEMEVIQSQSPPAQCTIFGVGASDLNENYVSDFRADIVPLHTTVKGLWDVRADWPFVRRVVSQYPLKYLRLLFPSAGRSTAIMVGAREHVRKLRRSNMPSAPEERAVVGGDANTHQEKISDWPEARFFRNIGNMRAIASGTYEFNGPKCEALFRFLRRGAKQGKMVVLVIPESPVYRKEFITEEVQQRFEAVLVEAQNKVPEVIWIRLDNVPELQSNHYYWDLVHLNAPGQVIATKIVLDQLNAAGIR